MKKTSETTQSAVHGLPNVTVLSMSVESILLIRPEAGTEEERENTEYKAHCILYTCTYHTVFIVCLDIRTLNGLPEFCYSYSTCFRLRNFHFLDFTLPLTLYSN
jgi:hypothetical protein